MLPLFSIRVAERSPVWERAVHAVSCACLSLTFIDLCAFFFSVWF